MPLPEEGRPSLFNGQFGRCEIEVEVIRKGRTMCTTRATLVQQDKPRVVVLAAFGCLEQSAGVDETITMSPPQITQVADCALRSGELQGIELPIMQRLEVRLDPASSTPGTSDVARIDGWIRFSDQTHFNTQHLPHHSNHWETHIWWHSGSLPTFLPRMFLSLSDKIGPFQHSVGAITCSP